MSYDGIIHLPSTAIPWFSDHEPDRFEAIHRLEKSKAVLLASIRKIDAQLKELKS